MGVVLLVCKRDLVESHDLADVDDTIAIEASGPRGKGHVAWRRRQSQVGGDGGHGHGLDARAVECGSGPRPSHGPAASDGREVVARSEVWWADLGPRGRIWAEGDGESSPPRDRGLTDLPPLRPDWGPAD